MRVEIPKDLLERLFFTVINDSLVVDPRTITVRFRECGDTLLGVVTPDSVVIYGYTTSGDLDKQSFHTDYEERVRTGISYSINIEFRKGPVGRIIIDEKTGKEIATIEGVGIYHSHPDDVQPTLPNDAPVGSTANLLIGNLSKFVRNCKEEIFEDEAKFDKQRGLRQYILDRQVVRKLKRGYVHQMLETPLSYIVAYNSKGVSIPIDIDASSGGKFSYF